MLDRIPHEIFGRIIKFSYIHKSFFGSSFQFDEISLPPIKATHVCRSWRTALLSDQTMWTSIVLDDQVGMHLDQLNETLARSKSAPLTVLIDECDDLVEPEITPHELRYMLSVISPQMYRCRQLQISISVEFGPFLSRLINKPFPMLQKLYFELNGMDASWERSNTLKEMHEILFSGDAPNLKHVLLRVVAGLKDLRLSLFKNLTGLHLYFDLDAIIDGNMLLDVLQSSPYLRKLEIFWYFPGRDQTVFSVPPNRLIPLPCLQDLMLRGGCGVDIVDLFLGYLDFPMENIKFNVVCHDDHSILNSTPLVHSLNRQRLTFLSINCDSSHVGVTFSERRDFISGGSLFKTILYPPRTPLHDPSNFIRRYNLSDVTYMSLKLGGILPKSVTLRTIFAALANLQYLCVAHGNSDKDRPLPGTPGPIPRSYLKALIPRPQHFNPDTQASSESETDDVTNLGSNIETGEGHSLPCPSLRTLEILFLDEGSVKLDEAYFRALVRCSRIRGQAGYPFQYIVTRHEGSSIADDIDAWLQAHEGFPMKVQPVV